MRVQGEHADVVEPLDPAASDHRQRALGGKIDSRMDIASGEQAVAADVIWRAFCFLPQMVLGWMAVGYFAIRQRKAKRKSAAAA